MVARLVRDEKVAGSNPVAPTNLIRKDHPKARLVRALLFLAFGFSLWSPWPLLQRGQQHAYLFLVSDRPRGAAFLCLALQL